jgi:hypothetical protein
MIPDVPLNGEHAGTSGGFSVGDGEFGVAVPLIVRRYSSPACPNVARDDAGF